MKAKMLIKPLGACPEAVKWVGERDIPTAWRECERGDWMLWIAAKMAGKKGWPTRQEVVLASCACAATALRFVPRGELRPHMAIAVARKWVRGKATMEDVWGAHAAAYAAHASAYAAHAAYAAAYAAHSAAYAAHSAAYADQSAAAYAAQSAAAYAAHAAAYAAQSAADYAHAAAARKRSLKRSAGIVRRMLIFPAIRPKAKQ